MASKDHYYEPEVLRAMSDDRLVNELCEAVAAYAPAARGLVISMMSGHDAARVRDLKAETLRRLKEARKPAPEPDRPGAA